MSGPIRLTAWRDLVGQQLVLDMSSPFVYVGRLAGESNGYLILEQADSHDLRDTSTTRDKYVREIRAVGLHPNRRQVWVSLNQVVGISRLDDVIVD